MDSKNQPNTQSSENEDDVPWEYPSESEIAKAKSAEQATGGLSSKVDPGKEAANSGCLLITVGLIAFGIATYFIGLESPTAARWFFLIGAAIAVLAVIFAMAQSEKGIATIFMVILFLGVSSLFSTCSSSSGDPIDIYFHK